MPTPSATYRVQVRPGFDLAATARITGYLAALGVSHLYTSPLTQAAPGSEHGYDVVDYSRVSAELGGEDGRARLLAALRDAGLKMVTDIVPNHVGVADAAANRWWWDVLTLGPQSAYARYFDIDWSRGRLLLPVLGDGPDGLTALRVEDGELRYYQHRFPLAAGTGPGMSPAQVHDHQHYELVSWRRGDAECNYRRFFAVSTLAGIRVEDPAVFADVHRLVLGWVAAGELDGIRVDHPDGLTDPTGYLQRLAADAGGSWIVAEKILQPGEDLPAIWPVAGTTGYDMAAIVDGIFADPAAEQPLTELAAELDGQPTDWSELVHAMKLDVAHGMQAAELARMARLTPDVPVAADALAEALACFAVYRSYLPDAGADTLTAALSQGRRRRPDLAPTLDALQPRLADPGDELGVRFAQQSGAVMAKAVEDTAYYRYTRFVAANEVGGDPSRIGLTPSEFHAAMAHRQQRYPAAMTALSTHDTKRSEDVRARLAVLTEMPQRWAQALRDLHRQAPIPDGSFANLLWQTVVGCWPIERERLHAYAEKAAREARASTSWNNPDPEVEAQFHQVVDRCYDDAGVRGQVEAVVVAITGPGWSNALGGKLLQLTAPGVPDVYQGTECWDNSLVDPDNRRPVDFARRARMLTELDERGRPVAVDDSGAAKLLVTSRALRARRDHPEAFTGYTPLQAAGVAAEHLVGFDRGGAIALATRLPLTLAAGGGWRDTTLTLPPGRWRDELTATEHEGTVDVGRLLAQLPVALLARSAA